jgi:hypothetical protein
MSLARTLGSDMFYISKYTGGGVNKGITIEGSDDLIIKSAGQKSDMSLFYMMLEKGILTLPEKREDVLSISNVCLGINNPSEEYIIKHGKNTMDIDGYYPTEKSFVFDRLDCYWGGAPVPPHDFTNIALGADRRMHNFLPRTPYGLVTTVPDNIDMNEFTYFKEKITTDGQYYYDEDGNKHSAIEYRPRVIAKLKESAARLPIRVSGDVAWSAVRLDSTHVRVTLIDPGYVNPADRKAVIHLQHLKGIKASDILRDRDLDIVDDRIKLTVPLGILRIVDITHSY